MPTPRIRSTVDVAGIAVSVDAADDRYAETARERLGVVGAVGQPEIEVVVGPDLPEWPEDLVLTSVEDFDGGSDGDRFWMFDGELAVRAEPDRVIVGGPVDTARQEDRFDDLLQFGFAAGAARPDRLMLHAAVIAREDAAALLVGGSGAGKSTLAAAAIVGGWTLLGDDLCVYRPDDGTVESVVRTPFVPREIADRHGLVGIHEPGPRDRVRLPVDVLGSGSRRLAGVVSVTHGVAGAVVPGSSGDLSVFDDALALPPFPYVLRRHLRAAAGLLGLPAVQLEHARDVEHRLPRAVELLDEAWVALNGQ